LRHEGVVQEGKEGRGAKGSKRVVGKAAGEERVFIPGEGPGWQMRSDVAGGEGVAGMAAKLEVVIQQVHP
jgi:hypothetical protein